jgi:hypothetical protein
VFQEQLEQERLEKERLEKELQEQLRLEQEARKKQLLLWCGVGVLVLVLSTLMLVVKKRKAL